MPRFFCPPALPRSPPLPGGFTVPRAAAAALAKRQRQAFCLCALVNVGLMLLMLINLKRSARLGPRGAERKAASCPEPDAGLLAQAPRRCPSPVPTGNQCHRESLLCRPRGLWPQPGSPAHRQHLAAGRRVLLKLLLARPCCALTCWPLLPGCSHLQNESLSLL